MTRDFVQNKLLLVLSILATATCINIQNFQEGPCIEPKADESFDLLWLANYAEWYFPIWSKFELYQWTASISGYSIQNVTEDLAARSCMLLTIGGDAGATQTAFQGKKKTTIDSSIVDHGVFDWTETHTDGTPGFRGRTYLTLTDNDKYYVSVSCWQNENQKAYSVHANVKSLDEAAKTKIRAHLLSLGFDVTNNWLEMQYDDCIDLDNPVTRNVPPEPLASRSVNPQNVNPNFPFPPNSENVNNNRNRNPTSIELFFNIFRSGIDFFQHVSQNFSRILVRFVTRLLTSLGLGRLL